MPPCQIRTSVGTEGDPVTAIKEAPSTSVLISDNHPSLARAFNRLADGLLKRTPTLARVWEPDPFDGLDTCKLQPFLTQCFLKI